MSLKQSCHVLITNQKLDPFSLVFVKPLVPMNGIAHKQFFVCVCVVQIETILTVFYKHRLCGVFIVCEPRQRCGDNGPCSSDHLSDFTHRSSVRLQQRVNLHTGIIPTDIDQQEGITPQTCRIKRIRKLAATRSDREKATVDGGRDGRCNFIP